MTRLPLPALESDGLTIRSKSFGDIYYSPDDGLAETQHVFINGNDLLRRFQSAPSDTPFIVGELGFGTGLNILATWLAWDQSDSKAPLQFWSCEGFPLPSSAFTEYLARIGDIWPSLAPYAGRLATMYPEPVAGTVQRDLAPGVSLTLAFGPVLEGLAGALFRADAWFLDGFAPSSNPDMWSADVMSAVARRSKPGATAATFTVAGAVRANLTAAGFDWEKTPGYGRKKHMLRAKIETPPATERAKPWFAIPRAVPGQGTAVIGGGIAGASTARALTDLGQETTLFSAGGLASGASGNPAGLVMPRLDADDGPAARFYRDAYLFAQQTYCTLGAEVFDPCGGSLAMDVRKQETLSAVGLWPSSQLERGSTMLTIPGAGVLRPALAVRKLADGLRVQQCRILSITRGHDGCWLASDRGNPFGPFANVVLCGGADKALIDGLPIKPSLGQVDVFAGPAVDAIRTDGAYIAPLGGALVAGATYAPYTDGEIQPSNENTDSNRRAAASLVNQDLGAPVERRAALRATTPDRHPVAGPVLDEAAAALAYEGLAQGRREDYPSAPYQEGLFTLTGLGSRGLVTAPLLANHVAALITSGVSPLTEDIAEMVHPARFLIRNIKRGQA